MLEYLDVGSERLHETTNRSLVRAEGLTGPPGTRGEWIDRPEEDGWIAPSLQQLPGRTVVLEGEVWPGGSVPLTVAAQIDAAWDQWDLVAKQLLGALSTPVLVKWRHAGDTKDLQGSFRLAGEVLPKLDADENGPFVAYQAILRSDDPRWYSQVEQTQTVGSPTVEGGMPLPVVFPIPFGSGSSGGSLTVTNAGNAKAWPRITVNGPIVGPVVENVTQGRALYFDGLVLAAGQALVIETRPANPRCAKVAGANVLGTLRWSASQWFGISSGATETVRFFGQGGGYGAGTSMTVAWRDAYIS